ncbi:hypothetical protein P4S72_13770 [Vibrio sp. PP-XX7]
MGTPTAGRTRTEVEPLIGMFVNTQAIRVDLSENPDTTIITGTSKRQGPCGTVAPRIPFEQVVEAVAPTEAFPILPSFK